MQSTKTVRSFLSRTGTGFKHFKFWFDNGYGEKLHTFSVAEAAYEFTRSGGKLFNIDAKELGVKFAKMRSFENFGPCDVSIGDGI